MQPNNFTNSEFARMQEHLEILSKQNAELKAELQFWKPRISFNAEMVGHVPTITYICRYGSDGLNKVWKGAELADARPELLEDMCISLAKECALIRSKKLTEMIQPYIQKAANFAHTARKTS